MFCPLDVVSNFPFFPKNALKNPSVIPLTINQETNYYASESSTQQLNICFTISIIISLLLLLLLCQRKICFLIESLPVLCLWAACAYSGREETKIDCWCRQYVGSTSAPSWNVTIASSMPSVPCAILKCHNSMLTSQVNKGIKLTAKTVDGDPAGYIKRWISRWEI